MFDIQETIDTQEPIIDEGAWPNFNDSDYFLKLSKMHMYKAIQPSVGSYMEAWHMRHAAQALGHWANELMDRRYKELEEENFKRIIDNIRG